MPTFAPSSPVILVGAVLAAVVCIAVGYALQRTRSRWLAWLWLLASVAVTERALRGEGHGLRMMVIVGVTLYGMKALVGVEHHRRVGAPLRLRDWLAFAVIWLGMQPASFVERRKLTLDRAHLFQAIAWCVAGAATIVGTRALYAQGDGLAPHAHAFLFLLGCSMITHFGVIGLVVVVMRCFGYPVSPQFRAPWLASNLQNFWARRWNIGFSVMTAMTIQRPLAPVLRATGSMFAAFLASGLLHELACSVPVGGGYGLPTAYFALHGVAMGIEQWLARRGRPLTGLVARVWTYCWVLLPAPLVFHSAFLDRVIVPLL